MAALIRLIPLLLALVVLPTRAQVASSDALPAELSINGVELVLVPAGWFWYLAPTPNLDQLPVGTKRHRDVRIWLDSYYIAKYEARASDFVRFMNAGGASENTLARQAEEQGTMLDKPVECTVRKAPDGSHVVIDPTRDLPVTELSWALAAEFAAWMGLRLPTEMEWQKAARGTDRRVFPWGDAYPDDTFSLFGWKTECDPAPVTSYPKGRSPYGAYNMAGNVPEYVADWYNKAYDDALKDGLRNPALAKEGSEVLESPPLKISKGGRWTRNAMGQRIFERRALPPYRTSNLDGARFAADAATVLEHLARGTAKVMETK